MLKHTHNLSLCVYLPANTHDSEPHVTHLWCHRVSGQDYELDRDRIQLEDILGEGQFGDVHAGKYTEKVRMRDFSVVKNY